MTDAGLTLVEVLVALSILGVLVTLLLPAIQAAREASRRVQCANNLKQIGVALNHYEALHGLYPAIYSNTGRTERGLPYAAHGYSVLARMLAELELGPLYNATNLSLGHAEPQSLLDNRTVALTVLSLFLCPSDNMPEVTGFGRCSYRFSTGHTPWFSPHHLAPEHWMGPFTVHQFYRAAQFPDGLTNTVGASERIQGDWTLGRFGEGGDYRLGDLGFGTKSTGNGEQEIARCLASPSDAVESRGGESWFFSGFHFTLYNHCLTPNPRSPDCSFDDIREDLYYRALHAGTFAARSHHPGGVNAVWMDGSVRFVRNAIDSAVWKSVATRNGREVVPGDAF
jgi:prepilin-type N-terminal cleavage/methylation domain-containing protein/prepilin-type processing-associated H-X9-DG protein